MTQFPFFEHTSKGIKFYVRLIPNASHDKIQGWYKLESGNFFLKISVIAIPEKGKANQALLALLSKTLKIAKSYIKITSGEADRNKTLLISDNSCDLSLLTSHKYL